MLCSPSDLIVTFRFISTTKHTKKHKKSLSTVLVLLFGSFRRTLGTPHSFVFTRLASGVFCCLAALGQVVV